MLRTGSFSSASNQWHRQTAEEVLQSLGTSKSGLSTSDVDIRRQEYGSNELIERGRRPVIYIVFEQLRSALVALLVVAAAVSLALGEVTDAVAIVTIVVLNTALGFYQDYRAEQALAALRRFEVPTVRVLRDGAWTEVTTSQLLPGDVVRIQAGDLVPADGRLLEVVNLRIDESTLTGESVDAEKQPDVLEGDDIGLADRTNMAFKGTLVTYGHALLAVTAIGMATQLGQIAESLQTVRHGPTPLQRRLGRLGRRLAVLALAVVAVVFVAGILRGQEPRLMLLTSLSLAVAIVPEGLPAVATVALALGAMRMFERRSLVRRLPAVETLGSVTVICTDKTGTITENRMTATEAHLAGHSLSLDESTASSTDPAEGLPLLMAAVTLCSDVQIQTDASSGKTQLFGQPTEVALVAAARKQGADKEALLRQFPLEVEFPFDSSRKRMTTLHLVDSGGMQRLAPVAEWQAAKALAMTKGAVDYITQACRWVWIDGRPVPFDELQQAAIERAHDQLAGDGRRVLGVAVRVFDQAPVEAEVADIERDMTFVGLVGLIDPPRPEVRRAVERCKRAGVRPIMITGDHPLTAATIAREVGIDVVSPPITGAEITGLGDDELADRTRQASVFARVAPVDKLRIVAALQEQGQIVAMTGDGVNDAPALKVADIGVAMGIRGADVSKQAADMVLLDDDFSTIVNAVEQGRIVYDNIRKFVQYTMTSNAGEVCVMLVGPLLGLPLPLLPLQILWINLVTDGLPGLALAAEPAERDVMQRPPHAPNSSMLDRKMWWDIAWIGGAMGLVSLLAGYWYATLHGGDTTYWRTVVFTVLTLSQMGNVLAIRSTRDSLFRIGILSNKPLLAAVLLTLLLQMSVIYAPPLQQVFRTTSLAPLDLLLCLGLSSLVFWLIEAAKWLHRRRDRFACISPGRSDGLG